MVAQLIDMSFFQMIKHNHCHLCVSVFVHLCEHLGNLRVDYMCIYWCLSLFLCSCAHSMKSKRQP